MVVASLLISHTITTAAFLLLSPPPNFDHPFGTVRARLIVAAQLIAGASTPEQRQGAVEAVHRNFPEVQVVSEPPSPDRLRPDGRLTRGLQHSVGLTFMAFVARPEDPSRHDPLRLGLRLPDRSAVMTEIPSLPPGPSPGLMSALLFPVSVIALLSLWAARTLTSPLRRLADAAEQFTLGRSDRPLSEQGPLEIGRAAKALNEMRARVRQMVEDRTRMLAAVSHDLRTPITRLRLRAEEIEPESLRREIIQDLDGMRTMVHSALSFLRDQARTSRHVRTDLPSLVQTVCDGFCDVGCDVKFIGPLHLEIDCDPDQLSRALMNLIDNGVKFGTSVTVELHAGAAGGSTVIDVKDDGPGIADSEKERVMEPFYRGDAARGMNEQECFGLGLSIARSVAEAHGGTLTLLDGVPKGLIARLTLAVRR
jgi:signal transduction histidine kinase